METTICIPNSHSSIHHILNAKTKRHTFSRKESKRQQRYRGTLTCNTVFVAADDLDKLCYLANETAERFKQKEFSFDYLLYKFCKLKKRWESDTAYLSSVSEIVLHSSYQQIIGIGKEAIPLILNEMVKKPGHWFWALNAITGVNPISQEKEGKIKEMTKAWLNWGRQEGYIK